MFTAILAFAAGLAAEHFLGLFNKAVDLVKSLIAKVKG